MAFLRETKQKSKATLTVSGIKTHTHWFWDLIQTKVPVKSVASQRVSSSILHVFSPEMSKTKSNGSKGIYDRKNLKSINKSDPRGMLSNCTH